MNDCLRCGGGKTRVIKIAKEDVRVCMDCNFKWWLGTNGYFYILTQNPLKWTKFKDDYLVVFKEDFLGYGENHVG